MAEMEVVSIPESIQMVETTEKEQQTFMEENAEEVRGSKMAQRPEEVLCCCCLFFVFHTGENLYHTGWRLQIKEWWNEL